MMKLIRRKDDTIIHEEDVSYGGCRRIKIMCILNDTPIRGKIVELMKRYKRNHDLIFLFFYRDDFDYEHQNAYACADFVRTGFEPVPMPWQPEHKIKRYSYAYNSQYQAMRDMLSE